MILVRCLTGSEMPYSHSRLVLADLAGRTGRSGAAHYLAVPAMNAATM